MAMGYILASDDVCLRKIIKDLENYHAQDMKSFPKNLSEAFTLTNNWKKSPSNLQKHCPGEGGAFATKV